MDFFSFSGASLQNTSVYKKKKKKNIKTHRKGQLGTSGFKQAEIIEAFKSTSRYLDDLLNIDNP